MNPKEAREAWCIELESGKWKQGTGQLARETDTGTEYCCLGVACELAVREGIIEGYDGTEGTLSDLAVMEWLGLRTGQAAYGPGGDGALTEDNDSGRPFKEIAVIIRNEPEGLIV